MIRDLETRRAALEREASALRARLNFLREEDRVRVRPAVTPGHNELAGRAESRPDPARPGAEFPNTTAALSTARAAGAAEFEISDSKVQKGNPGSSASEISDLRFQKWDSEISTRASDLRTTPELSTRASGLSALRNGAPGNPVTAFSRLGSRSGIGGRGASADSQVIDPAADTCREQLTVQDQLISNCEERAAINRAGLEASKRSTLELGEALKAKDAMAARMEEQHRMELKAARGSRLHRFGRALQYVGAGVVIGMAVAL